MARSSVTARQNHAETRQPMGSQESGVSALVRQLVTLLWRCGEARLPQHALSPAVPSRCKSCGLLLYFLCVCWDCLAKDSGGGMKTVDLVQNN